MSSFIVENKTINRFLTWLYWIKSDEIYINRVYREFYKLKYKIDDNYEENLKEKEFNRLGLNMLKMNYKAVNYRYNEKNKPIDFEFKYEKVKDVQVLKSLQCFIYQCSEGDIPKSKLYKVLIKIESVLKNAIIEKYTDYNKLEWG